ncbi:MAG TPA: PPOX class F420-dependent oxidoreductase [Mycobacteriales bacterium]|nr:PPOX class F420-dependent oxidoreductase [Mycobacteriales bacterium]
MDADQARDFLASSHRAVLATRRSDGRTQMSPVTAAVDDDGRVCVSTRETALKARHLRRDPYAALCVLSDGFFGDWVQVEGPVEVVALPEAMELLVDYYRRVSGEHPDWADYRRAMTEERRVLLRMTIERAGPSVSG